MKKVFIIDPYYADSHRYWTESLKDNLSAEVTIFSKSPVHWKWRMEASAIDFAKEVTKSGVIPDVFIATDYLHLALFKSFLPRAYLDARFVIYMHENQLTYPRSKKDSDTIHHRDNHYGFINYTSCLLADAVAFNSHYHRKSFFEGLSALSQKLPERLAIEEIEKKSRVIPLTMEYTHSTYEPKDIQTKTVVWNHRWDYDKRPEVFLEGMIQLKNAGYDFRLLLLGRMDPTRKDIFKDYLEKLEDRIDHLGYASSYDIYLGLLRNADIIVSTSVHEFFGISVLEGLMAGCQPILPHDLAYPELIPSSLGEQSLYKGEGFVEAMAHALSPNNEWNAHHASLVKNHIVEKFSWTNNENSYNQWLELE